MYSMKLLYQPEIIAVDWFLRKGVICQISRIFCKDLYIVNCLVLRSFGFRRFL